MHEEFTSEEFLLDDEETEGVTEPTDADLEDTEDDPALDEEEGE